MWIEANPSKNGAWSRWCEAINHRRRWHLALFINTRQLTGQITTSLLQQCSSCARIPDIFYAPKIKMPADAHIKILYLKTHDFLVFNIILIALWLEFCGPHFQISMGSSSGVPGSTLMAKSHSTHRARENRAVACLHCYRRRRFIFIDGQQ